MTFALVAVIVMLALYIGALHRALHRMRQGTAELETAEADAASAAEREAGVAILELLEAKLTDCPDEWHVANGAFLHQPSGTAILQDGDTMVVRRDSIGFAVPADWQERLLRAGQLRNAKALVAALAGDGGEND